MSETTSVIPASEPTANTPAAVETQSQALNIKDVLEKGKLPEEAPKLKEDDERLSSRFAALSRKEKQILEQKKAMQEQLAEIEKIKAREALKETDKTKWLEEHGLSIEDLVQAYLGKEDIKKEPTVEDKVSSEIEKAIKEFETRQKAKEEEALKRAEEERLKAEQAYYDEQVTAYKDSIRKTVETNAEKYELVAANDAYDEVFDVVEQYFNATAVYDKKTGKLVKEGEVLPVEKALDYVEDYYFEKLQELLSKTRKLKPQVSEPVVEPVKDSTPKQAIKESLTPSSVTLTNNKVTGVVPVDQPHKLSAEESKKRAAALLKWN